MTRNNDKDSLCHPFETVTAGVSTHDVMARTNGRLFHGFETVTAGVGTHDVTTRTNYKDSKLRF